MCSDKYSKFYLIMLVSISVVVFCLPTRSYAQIPDADADGLSDWAEVHTYYTDPNNSDTDADGYADGIEIAHHYSPHKAKATLSQHDYDGDGLSDYMELQFGTDINNPDSDEDGFEDYEEIVHSYDPLSVVPKKLPQKIVINTQTQEVTALLNNIPLTTFVSSTGKPGYDTPLGQYKIENKHKRAWSATYGLWMPYWMGFIGTTYGIHELPEWPGGYKEGADHLGTPVSHGCVRIGEGDAAWLWNWTEVGTPVEVL